MENLSKKPTKGILKNSSSVEQPDTQIVRQSSQEKDLKWDEMNIIQTLHPPDKDYGHMKIEEPKTPFSYYAEDEEGEVNSDNEISNEIDPENLAELINRKTKKSSKSPFSFDNIDVDANKMDAEDDDDDDDEEFANETEEERSRRKEFEQKRKTHYNEFQMVKLARQLLENEMEDDDDDDAEMSRNIQSDISQV